MRLILTFLILSILAPENSNCQDASPCFYEQRLKKLAESHPQIHEELDYFLNERFSRSSEKEESESIVTIPVVIHIIHHGEPVGTGANISNEKVFSQIDILNKDYSYTNSDADKVPQAFRPVAGDTNIQFCLVQKDANGNPHPGFNRIEYGTIPDFDYIEEVIKKQTSWNSRKFLNIWTLKMPEDQVLGYAYPPIPSILNTTSDGVVIAHDKFGEGAESLGRTATHEIGHYLGLAHPWGPIESCNSDDGIDDTPNCSAPYYGCPSFPQMSCGTVDMTMNFMDYVNDNCMYMFTQGQGSRMRQVLSVERQQITSGFDFICNLSTATEDHKAPQNSIKTFPNPTNDLLYVGIPEGSETKAIDIALFNISGQQISKDRYHINILEDNIQLSLAHLRSGTYLVKVSIEDEIFVTKAILMSRH